MCAVIGVTSDEVTDEVISLIKELFIQSRIRGKHSTGISFTDFGKINSIIEPISSDLFINNFDFSFLPKKLSMVGHCRYSTSDIKYNQPVFNKNYSVVHNGVITQLDSSEWENEFGYKCLGKNDSELLLQSIDSGMEPLLEFSKSSMSVIYLKKNGELSFFRNGTRPLYYFEYNGDNFISSTKDILIRTFKNVLGLTIFPSNCIPGRIYTVINNGIKINEVCDIIDLQLLW